MSSSVRTTKRVHAVEGVRFFKQVAESTWRNSFPVAEAVYPLKKGGGAQSAPRGCPFGFPGLSKTTPCRPRDRVKSSQDFTFAFFSPFLRGNFRGDGTLLRSAVFLSQNRESRGLRQTTAESALQMPAAPNADESLHRLAGCSTPMASAMIFS